MSRMDTSLLDTHQELLLERIEGMVQRIKVGYSQVESIWHSLLAETQLNLFAGDRVIRVVCRALYGAKTQSKSPLLDPALETWDVEWRHGQDMLKMVSFRIDQGWVNHASQILLSISEAFYAAEKKMRIILRAVKRLQSENIAEKAWKDDATGYPRKEEDRRIRFSKIIDAWAELFISLDFYGFPDDFAKLEDRISEILNESGGWKKTGWRTAFTESGYADPFFSDPDDTDPSESRAQREARNPSAPSFRNPFSRQQRDKSSHQRSPESDATAGSQSKSQSKARAEPKRPRTAYSGKAYSRSTRSSEARSNNAHANKSRFKDTHSSRAGRSNSAFEEVDVDELHDFFDQNRQSPGQNRVSKLDLQSYNEEWDKLEPNSAAIPFPCKKLSAGDISRVSLLYPRRGFYMDPDHTAIANIQAFFLAAFDLKPRYWESARHLKMGFEEAAEKSKVEALKEQLKKDRFRYHPDKLGQRTEGAENSGPLQDNPTAKLVHLAVSRLLDECKCYS
ncbi:MAG: hypothetical protein M1820_000500 [Bogoriella megaspora]|nr:MAG: hypothetical protein M1820_000500 [Bogoriella megaspora]